MAEVIYGARPYEWRQLAGISALEGHILEVVSAPESVMPVCSESVRTNRGKIPSRVVNGVAVGIGSWPSCQLGGRETIAKYEEEASTTGYWRGAFLRTGHNGVIAIDCDIEDPDMAQRIRATLTSMIGVPQISVRTRGGSPRWLALIRIKDGPAFSGKVVISAPAVLDSQGLRKPQQVECLGSGHGAVLAGTHPSGERYEWTAGICLYSMTRQQFTDFRDIAHDMLTEGLSGEDSRALIGAAYSIEWCGTEKEACKSKSTAVTLPQDVLARLISDDPGVAYLRNIKYPVYGTKPDGGLLVQCPNYREHSNKDTSAIYYPVGNPRCADTGGFKCLHAHCAGKGRQWFLNAIRELPEYKDAPEPDPTCFISRPHDIKFEDESAVAQAAELQAAQEQAAVAEHKEALNLADLKSVVERDKLGLIENRTRAEDLRRAREELRPFLIKQADGSYDEERPTYRSTNLSIYTALKHPVICGMDIRMDNYRRVITVRKHGGTERRPLLNEDYTRVMNNLEQAGFKRITKTSVADQLDLHAREYEYDDLAEFVERCVPAWDGVPRIDTLFTEHFHAHISDVQTPAYYAAAARYFMMAMVKRASTPYTPVKADDVLVFQGEQGCGKSTAVACFALRPGDALEGLSFTYDPGEWAIRINGHNIAEIPEMSGYSRKDINDVKFILSQCEDTYRPKYERVTITRSRRCMAILTTNDPQVLTDVTGNRRFIIIEIDKGERIDVQWLRDNIYQIWAEARYMLEQSGGYIPQREVEELGKEVALLFVKGDPIKADVLAMAEQLYKSSSVGVDVHDIIKGIGSGYGLTLDVKNGGRVGTILRNNGWYSLRARMPDGSRPTVFRKASDR